MAKRTPCYNAVFCCEDRQRCMCRPLASTLAVLLRYKASHPKSAQECELSAFPPKKLTFGNERLQCVPFLDRSRVGLLVWPAGRLTLARCSAPVLSTLGCKTEELDTGVLAEAAGRLRARKQEPGASILCRTVAVQYQCCNNTPKCQPNFRAEYRLWQPYARCLLVTSACIVSCARAPRCARPPMSL